MIRRLVLAVAFALATPALATAQRGVVSGLGRGRTPGKLARDPGVVIPRQVNMINVLIERRGEVALSDSQFARIIAIKRTLDSTNAPMLRKLDSVQRLFRGGAPMFSAPSETRRDSLAEAHFVVREASSIVRVNNLDARDRAYALLDMQQLIRAQALETKAEKLIEDDAKKKP